MKIFRIVAVTITISISLVAIHKCKRVFAQNSQVIEHDWNATYTGQNLNHPSGIFKIPSANGGAAANWLFIADTGNNKIKVFEPGVGLIDVAGNGVAGNIDGAPSSAEFHNPTGVAGPGYVTISDPLHNGQFSSAIRLTVFDTGNNSVRQVCVTGNIDPRALICNPSSYVKTVSTGQTLNSPTMGSTSNFTNSGSHTVLTLNASFQATLLAGTGSPGYVNGTLTQAQFAGPTKVAPGPNGSLLVADAGNFVIRSISGNSVSTFSGSGQRGYQDGSASVAKFELPVSVAYNPGDGYTYVADAMNYCIRRIDTSGNVSTYAGAHLPGNTDGSLSDARFASPVDLIVDGGTMYVADSGNNSIREINMATGQVSTLIR